MFTKAPLALVAAMSLALSTLALLPATASAASTPRLILVNYSHCYENPSAPKCPGYFESEQDTLPGNLADNPFKRASHEQRVPTSQRS